TDCRPNQSTERRLQRLAAHCSLECFILAALPLFPFPQRLFGLYALGNVDIDPEHTHDAAVLVVMPAPPGTEPSNLVGRKNNSEFQVERFVIADSSIDLGFDRAEIVRMHPRTKGFVRSRMVQAEDIFEFPRPGSSPALYIPVPEADIPAAHRQPQAGFTLLQCCVEPAAFRNVSNDAVESSIGELAAYQLANEDRPILAFEAPFA